MTGPDPEEDASDRSLKCARPGLEFAEFFRLQTLLTGVVFRLSKEPAVDITAMISIERRGVHFAGQMSLVLAVFVLGLVSSPAASSALPVTYRDVVVQQTPIRVLRCPMCENSALILAEQDIIKSKKSGYSDQRIAELEGMLMNNRVRKSGYSDQRLAEMEAMLLNGNKMRRSGFSDQRIAEMEAMLMNSMKRPAQRALTGDQSRSSIPHSTIQ
ncbi:uncharacterized protein LOC100900028 [Galendromus occidentalis]|uniref:Uncharacterized protein LOC100900028 n=1 Tax=Galendromus occidentalis TaxID=34638 RepID=A0AAJ7PA97_9ACAR|nr:uncharacterized protein LOC100900028 [Galendromus occidentalis]